MGVNAMCKRAIAPTALFCSPLPFFSLVRPIHPPGNSMPLTCPVAAGKKKGGAGGGRAIEEGGRQGWRGARATTRAQEVERPCRGSKVAESGVEIQNGALFTNGHALNALPGHRFHDS